MSLVGPPLERPTKLVRLLEIGLSVSPDASALVTLERTWSWSEFERTATRLAGGYLSLGLAPGDRVASLMPNRGALLVHYLACMKAGLAATPLNYRYQAPEVDHALQVSEASILIAHAERAEMLSRSKCAAKLPKGIITYGAEGNSHPQLETLMTKSGPLPELPPVTAEAVAFIFFTSGSTGKPKGVTHTHRTFGWLVASAVAGFGLTSTDVFLPATSASHIAATSFAFAGLAAGASVAMARSFDGAEILPLLRTARPSILCMLPASLFALVRDHGATPEDFQSIRRCVSGGDKIAAELEREFTDLTGFAIEELYGMTETGTSVMNPTAAGNRIGSLGQLAPGFEASIRDDDGVETPAGTAGRLWIKSPSNAIGYWRRPDATAETMIGDWLDTGDIVAADEQGYLWFRGRKKQIIVHDGSNICPQEVEESLLENKAVASACVLGVHDLIHGETVRAYVELNAGVTQPTPAELIKFSQSRIGYKAPDEIIVLDEMPMNAVGKVDRTRLRQLADAAANIHLK